MQPLPAPHNWNGIPLPPNTQFLAPSVGMEKMSDVLCEFVEPLEPENLPLEHHRSLLTFALIAWNYEMMPPEKQAEMVAMLEEYPPEAMETFQYLLDRKKAVFPDNHRLMTSSNLTLDAAGDRFIQVASTLSEPT